ncbi:hypothetical protein [Amycolatopsis sp. EV170708-02-1]|uniref:hypothetical protein n=1 Tax=Amycolatopsis sp. EV170708-02-1 TaxID=2919322 RepID=UPI001F0BA294|nr:hypothetical protein [Amycolatopsis sp. EV170708-02-1]UMP05752.1 hypothetical protein MJQ72_13365 [Amycolatopsis sp. EV170708-02-1]
MQDWYTRTARLRFQVFTGTPYTHVSPMEWRIDPGALRDIARSRGYAEIAPMFQGCLSFQFAPGHVPPVPVFDGPDRPDKDRERWLLNQLSGSDRVWISLKHANLSARRVAEVAETEGLRVAADLTDPGDRLLLLSRDPSPPRLPLPARTGLRFRYAWLNYIAPATVLVLLGAAAVIAGIPSGHEAPIVGLLFMAAFAGAIPAAFTTTLFPRTTRVGWLAREFDGSHHVEFAIRTYQIPADLVVQIAAYHGYELYGQSAPQAPLPALRFCKRV